MDMKERIRGSLLGTAIGDALGHPTEFIGSVDAIRARYGPRGVTSFMASGRHAAGTFTDDTQMTIAVARALTKTRNASLDEMMRVMSHEFVSWSRHATNNRAPGGTCLEGCRRLEQGIPWRQAGVKQSKGCGAAMRAAPVAWFFYHDESALIEVAAAQSALTHSHPTGIASSVAMAAAVAHVMKTGSIAGVLDAVISTTKKCTASLMVSLGADKDLADRIGVREQVSLLEKTKEMLTVFDDDVCALLGGAWVGEEAVATALWCALTAPNAFEALVRGANSSGDSDSIASMAGGIVGALHGVSVFPAALVRDVERTADLLALADACASSGRVVPAHADFFSAERPQQRHPIYDDIEEEQARELDDTRPHRPCSQDDAGDDGSN
jgi:ADP-ribosylglycohydrolase